jgi:hypothetical protein
LYLFTDFNFQISICIYLQKIDNQPNRSWKELTLKLKVDEKKSSLVENNKPSCSDASKVNKVPTKKRAIYIVMHVSRVTIGELHAKASAPVKVSYLKKYKHSVLASAK